MKRCIHFLLTLVFLNGSVLAGQHDSGMRGDHGTKPGDGASMMSGGQGMGMAAPGTMMTPGEIRKVDKNQSKVTIRHGPIENLGMPKMTMVFRVKDPAMLDQVKPGDKVNFHAEDVGGALTVMGWELAH